MGVFSFLQPPKKGAPGTQIAELEGSLARLRAEHKSVQAIVESHGQKRAEMLLSDASDADIARLDADANLAQIRLERLELVETELVERIESGRAKAEREHLAREHERAAAQIETATKGLEGPINALAVAFAELVKAIPAETFLRKYSDRHVPPQQPASPEDVARTILANALYVAEPEIFETQKQRSAFAAYGAGVERVLSVYSFGGGVMLPRNHGLNGEECEIHPAPIAADKLIVAPLREKARTLRDGVAELLQAAE
jgi:hypothetical protein